MDRKQLAQAIYNTSSLKGTFTLRSGQIANEYFDKYLFESDPALLNEITEVMKLSIPSETEILAGLELGGIPIATVLSMKTGLAAAFTRKKAKEYGTCKLAEGADVSGKHVLIIEDVVTTGGAIIDGVRELRKLGGIIDTVLCVIQRDERATGILAEQGMKLIPAFTMDELHKAVK